MNKILLIIFLFSVITIEAQTENFDLATFQRPQGWQRLDTNGVVMLYHSNANNGVTSFCQIFLFPSYDAGDDANANFQNEWNNRIVRTTGTATLPQPQTEKTPEGWTAVSGRGNIEANGIKYTCLLTAITGHGKEMSVIVNVAGDYNDEVRVFFQHLDLRAPVVTGNLWNGNDSPPLTNTNPAGQLDYIYKVPAGWTPQKYNDGGVVITSPVFGTGEKCTISLLPMRPAAGNLQTAAGSIFSEIFGNNFVPATTYTSPSMIQGYSPQGWEYFITKQGLKPRTGNLSEVFAFVFVAKLGTQMAVITGISKDPLVSNCFGLNLADVWPKFFYNLQFKNWNAATSEKETMKRLAGVWASATATASDRMAIAPNGRYAGASAAQHYYGNGSNTITSVTDAYFGDGAYSVKGYQITLTKDSEKNKPETAWFRIEKESMDAGRTWKDKLHLLRKSRVDGSDFELAYEKQ